MHALRENSLILLYLGFFFCLCIALFNSYQVFKNFAQQKTEKKHEQRWEKLLFNQAESYLKGGRSIQSIKKQFGRRLHFDTTLLYLERVFDKLAMEKNSNEKELQELFEGWFSVLTEKYRNSETIVVQFLTFLIGKYHVHNGYVGQFLMELLTGGDMELCQEAFYTICKQSQGRTLNRAVRALNRQSFDLNRKIIADALHGFTGKTSDLEANIFDDLEGLKPSLLVGLIDFMGEEASQDLRKRFIKLLKDKGTDKEVRIAFIKYFGRVYEPLAYDLLLDLADDSQWEYAAMAAKALAIYPGSKTTQQVKKHLSDANWHVRYNNAMTLGFIASRSEVEEILSCDDRYAREIMEYALEKMERKDEDRDVVA